MYVPFLSQIDSGLLPILYRIDKKPDWYVFLNMFVPFCVCVRKGKEKDLKKNEAVSSSRL